MLRHLRLRLAQLIFPTAFHDGGAVPVAQTYSRPAKPGSRMEARQKEQKAYGDTLRRLHDAYIVAQGKPMFWPDIVAVLGNDRGRHEYDALQLILRLSRHRDVGCRWPAFARAVALFKVMWPRGVIMPSPIPTPGVSP